MESVNYKIKYLKYKNKYLDLKEQYGGIVYFSGDHIFFFDSSIIDPSKTIRLNALEQTNNLSKEDLNFDKITNEIFNNGGGWSYKKGDKEIKKIESNVNIAKAAAKATAVAAGKTASAGLEKGKQLANAGLEKAKQVSSALSEKNRLALCEKCKNANCPLVGGELEFMGGSLSLQNDPTLIELINKSKDLTDINILNGLKAILEDNGIIGINRAIVCRITTGANPFDKPKIYLYQRW
jgi:hypothetical protein